MNAMLKKSLRSDLAFVADWIEPGSSVLDLGCGDGALLAYLQEKKACKCYGVEIDDEKVLASMNNGVNVLQQNLEDGLALFGDQSFDTVLQLESLQMLQHTQNMLREIARVGRQSIVTFPNFAYWANRVSILRGRMPMTKSLPYQWYDTPNLRFSTIADFTDLASHSGLEILDKVALHEGQPVQFLPKLRGSLAVFRFRNKQGN